MALRSCAYSSSIADVGTAAIIIANTYQRQADIRDSIKNVVRYRWFDCCARGRMGEARHSWISQGHGHRHQWYIVSADSDTRQWRGSLTGQTIFRAIPGSVCFTSDRGANRYPVDESRAFRHTTSHITQSCQAARQEGLANDISQSRICARDGTAREQHEPRAIWTGKIQAVVGQ